VDQTAQPISGGQRDTAHPAVFRMLGREDGLNLLCSATLIAPNLLLTARHCVAAVPEGPVHCGQFPFGESHAADQLLFSNDVEPNLESRWYRGVEIVVEAGGLDLCGHDLALVMLEAPIASQTVAPLEPELMLPVPTSSSYSSVGYGDSDVDTGPSYGVRRARAELHVLCGTGTCPAGVTDTEFVGTEGVCKGDSGGPALNAEGRVIGVASRGADPCDGPVYAAVQSWADWLRGAASRAAAAGSYALPRWAGNAAAPPVLSDAGPPPTPNPGSIPSDATGCSVRGGSRPRTSAFGALLGCTWLLCRARRPSRALTPAPTV
jgi:Trypsin